MGAVGRGEEEVGCVDVEFVEVEFVDVEFEFVELFEALPLEPAGLEVNVNVTGMETVKDSV